MKKKVLKYILIFAYPVIEALDIFITGCIFEEKFDMTPGAIILASFGFLMLLIDYTFKKIDELKDNKE